MHRAPRREAPQRHASRIALFLHRKDAMMGSTRPASKRAKGSGKVPGLAKTSAEDQQPRFQADSYDSAPRAKTPPYSSAPVSTKFLGTGSSLENESARPATEARKASAPLRALHEYRTNTAYCQCENHHSQPSWSRSPPTRVRLLRCSRDLAHDKLSQGGAVVALKLAMQVPRRAVHRSTVWHILVRHV